MVVVEEDSEPRTTASEVHGEPPTSVNLRLHVRESRVERLAGRGGPREGDVIGVAQPRARAERSARIEDQRKTKNAGVREETSQGRMNSARSLWK